MTRPVSTMTPGIVLVCAALVVSPLFLPASQRRYALVAAAVGAAGLFADWLLEADLGTRRFTPARHFSEAVADPDFA